MKFVLFVFCISFSSTAFGITGSITDPGFSSEEELPDSFLGPTRGSFGIQLSRNLRRSGDEFLSPYRRDGFFDTLFIKSDLNLVYPLSKKLSLLKDSKFFNETDLFFILSYRRPAYGDLKEVKRYCFKLYLCFGNINLGISSPFLKGHYFKSQYSVYLSLPFTSKESLKKKQILGLGSSLKTEYALFSKGGFTLSAISSHFLDISAYGSKWGNVETSFYNEFFSLFNQPGLRLHYAKSALIPLLFIYGSHRFSLNLKGVPYNRASLGVSSTWSVSQALRVVIGLVWGDDIDKDPARVQKIKIFNPDSTFVNGGLSYSF